MSLDDLLEDAESIAKLEPVGTPRASGKSFEHRFRFPAQQFKLGMGDQPVDPATRKAAGRITELDEAAGTLVLRRGPSFADVALPVALVPPGPYRTDEQRGALARLATSVLANDGGYPALRDMSLFDTRTKPTTDHNMMVVFPSGVVTDYFDTIQLRYVIPLDLDRTQIEFAFFGRTTDTDEALWHRVRQGPPTPSWKKKS